MLKVKNFAAAKLQHAASNFLAAAIKPARKRAAPKRATPLMPVGPPLGRSVGRSSGRTVHAGLASAVVRQAFVRRSFRSFAGGGAALAADE